MHEKRVRELVGKIASLTHRRVRIVMNDESSYATEHRYRREDLRLAIRQVINMPGEHR